MNWYNFEHKHSGINYLTPHQRHSGQAEQVLKKRKAVYEEAKLKHPDRWTGKTRNWTVENTVWLNPENVNSLEKKELSKSS